ncbi:MAG TPA: site-2 protease family protein [Acidimicrobiales bacterium]|nr:site-2 protease family protein [Acidimicrobiales bacterium]
MTAKAHFHVLGIPVRIEPLFWIASVLLAYNLGDARLIVMWVAVVLVSVLIHELGHGIALKLFGQPSSIVLHGFGGLTSSPRKLDRRRSIAVSLAGPLAALAVLGIPALALRDSDWGTEVAIDYALSDDVFGLWPILFFAAYVNVWWSIANLLPIRPLDGGNVLTELVGIQKARVVSVVVGVAAAIWAYTHADGLRYAAFFAGFLAFVNFSEYRRDQGGVRAPSAFDVEGPSTERPPRRGGRPTAPPTRRPAESDPLRSLGGDLEPAAAESLIWSLVRTGDVAAARRVLARTTGPVSPFATATVALVAGEGIEPLVRAYLDRPAGPSNLAVATVVGDRGDAEALAHRLVAAGDVGVDAATGLQTHLHYAERFRPAALVGELVHDEAAATRAQTAFDVACSWARAGEPERGLRWIVTALQDGFSATVLLDGEPDLAAVRALKGWPQVRDRLA